jgi:hypothetical protein
MPPRESIFCVPHADPGEHLIGRDAILEEIDRTLNTTDGPTLLTALQGTGGIGKTQLAARYCWSRRERQTRKYPHPSTSARPPRLGDWPRSGADGGISTLSLCHAGPTPAKDAVLL